MEGGKVVDQAWVTLCTNDSYALGALVLAHSLKRVDTNRQLVVLITPGVTQGLREQMHNVFDLVTHVDILDSNDSANLALLTRPELGITFTKLHCWRLTQYSKCVFLDADTLVIKNCDELFDREELSAAPDVGWPDCFNSGVFVFRPSDETYLSLLQCAVQRGSFDGGDQGLLNIFFSDWAHKDISKHLPFIYNMNSNVSYSYLPAYKYFGKDVKIVHFIGQFKPWMNYYDKASGQVQPRQGSTHLIEHLNYWWDIFAVSILSHLDEATQVHLFQTNVHAYSNEKVDNFQLSSSLFNNLPDYSNIILQMPSKTIYSFNEASNDTVSKQLLSSADKTKKMEIFKFLKHYEPIYWAPFQPPSEIEPESWFPIFRDDPIWSTPENIAQLTKPESLHLILEKQLSQKQVTNRKNGTEKRNDKHKSTENQTEKTWINNEKLIGCEKLKNPADPQHMLDCTPAEPLSVTYSALVESSMPHDAFKIRNIVNSQQKEIHNHQIPEFVKPENKILLAEKEENQIFTKGSSKEQSSKKLKFKLKRKMTEELPRLIVDKSEPMESITATKSPKPKIGLQLVFKFKPKPTPKICPKCGYKFIHKSDLKSTTKKTSKLQTKEIPTSKTTSSKLPTKELSKSHKIDSKVKLSGIIKLKTKSNMQPKLHSSFQSPVKNKQFQESETESKTNNIDSSLQSAKNTIKHELKHTLDELKSENILDQKIDSETCQLCKVSQSINYLEPKPESVQSPKENVNELPIIPFSQFNLAGQLAEMSLNNSQSMYEKTLDEQARRIAWERGQMDYMGADAWENIQKKIEETMVRNAPK